MRLFIACYIPGNVKNEILKHQNILKKSGADVRWVRLENLHLTMKFLGEVEENRIREISEGLSKAVDGFSSFNVGLSGLGAFPGHKVSRSIVDFILHSVSGVNDRGSSGPRSMTNIPSLSLRSMSFFRRN